MSEQQLPLHHIDTSVILEPSTTDNGRCCRRYLQKVGYNYTGKLSLAVFGEILVSIISTEVYNDMHDFLDVFAHLLRIRNISLYTPRNIGQTLNKILELDTRVGPTDREILACAIEDNAVNLVTLDKDLIGNKRLEKEFGIRIVHPKDLL